MKVSIIIRAYNAERTVERAVNSALLQDFPREDFQIVIVNDGSTDGTRKILKKFEGTRNVLIVDQENRGYTGAANIGFAKSTGDYIVLLDSDDYFDLSLLKELSGVLDKQTNVTFVYPDYYEEFEGQKKIVSPKNIFETTAGGIMFRRNKMPDGAFYTESLFFPEYDIFLRTINIWHGVHHPKPLLHYSRRGDSVTADSNGVRRGIYELKQLHPDKLAMIKKIRGYDLISRD